MSKQVSPQLPLSLTLSDEATFDNFIAGDNRALLQQIQHSLTDSAEVFIYFWGSGLGCSHLLQAICQHVSSRQGRSAYIPLSEIAMLHPMMLEGLENMDVVCLDDIHLIKDDQMWQEAIFHLYNRIKQQQGKLFIAANTVPNNIGLTLPDLVSRLNWGLVYSLQPLNEADKIMALQQRAQRKGMQLSDDVARYLISRCSRDMHSLFDLLDALDRASLAAQRKLTIPFVKMALDL